MSGEIEAAGALATAGVVGAALEGREGGQPGSGNCPNCDAPVSGRFCSNCGQHALPHRKLAKVVGEFLNGLWHLDTKTWRTIPMVILRPGTLTRNYVYGKRARYLSPLTMFLFSIFLMFFAFSLFGGINPNVNVAPEAEREAMAEELDRARANLAGARAELARAEANPPAGEPAGLSARLARGGVRIAEAQVQRIEAQIEAQEREVSTEQPTAAEPAAEAPAETAAPAQPEAPVAAAQAGGFQVGVTTDDPETARAIESGEQRWQDVVREAAESGELDVNLGHPYLNHRALETLKNPDFAIYKVQEAASKFSFLLAPLSLPFIALLFLWRRGLTLFDHVVYALYALSFASLLFVVLLVGARAFGANGVAMMILSNVLLLGVLPVHTYFQLKGAYALGWWSALWRTFFMLFFAILIAAIFLSLVLILGLAG